MKKVGQLAAFWKQVDELTEKITNMSEEELKEVFGGLFQFLSLRKDNILCMIMVQMEV